MRKPTDLVKDFDLNGTDDLVSDISTVADVNAATAFHLPNRNWNLIIDDYNAHSKRKFKFSGLQCKLILEFVKKGVPPKHMFESLGVSNQSYTTLVSQAVDLNDRMEVLINQDPLDDDQYDELQLLMRHPLRLLMGDLSRAQGISNLFHWEQFNDMCSRYPELKLTQMKAKFKDVFGDKNAEGAGQTVIINLGGDFVDKM